MGKTEFCWVCDAEKPIEDLVFTADRYVCDTKECLLGAFEKSIEEHNLISGRLEAIRCS
jgi:hypothetical protein